VILKFSADCILKFKQQYRLCSVPVADQYCWLAHSLWLMGPVQLLAQVKTEGRRLWGIWQTHSSQLKLNEWSCYQPQLPPLALSEMLLIREMWCAHKSLPVLAPFSLARKGKLRSGSGIACLSELCSDAGLLVLHYPHPEHMPVRGSIRL